jgi:hypothetical protein
VTRSGLVEVWIDVLERFEILLQREVREVFEHPSLTVFGLITCDAYTVTRMIEITAKKLMREKGRTAMVVMVGTVEVNV